MIQIHAADGTPVAAGVRNHDVQIRLEADSTPTYLQLTVIPEYDFDGSEYVLFPACCYNGNRFDVLIIRPSLPRRKRGWICL